MFVASYDVVRLAEFIDRLMSFWSQAISINSSIDIEEGWCGSRNNMFVRRLMCYHVCSPHNLSIHHHMAGVWSAVRYPIKHLASIPHGRASPAAYSWSWSRHGKGVSLFATWHCFSVMPIICLVNCPREVKDIWLLTLCFQILIRSVTWRIFYFIHPTDQVMWKWVEAPKSLLLLCWPKRSKLQGIRSSSGGDTNLLLSQHFRWHCKKSKGEEQVLALLPILQTLKPCNLRCVQVYLALRKHLWGFGSAPPYHRLDLDSLYAHEAEVPNSFWASKSSNIITDYSST